MARTSNIVLKYNIYSMLATSGWPYTTIHDYNNTNVLMLRYTFDNKAIKVGTHFFETLP